MSGIGFRSNDVDVCGLTRVPGQGGHLEKKPIFIYIW